MQPTESAEPTVTGNQLPDDILAKSAEAYVATDVFQWANNLVQYKDELEIDLFFFNKNMVPYRTSRSDALKKQMEPLFVDGLLEDVLQGAEDGMLVRDFEEAEAEENVLQRTRLGNVEKAVELLNWIKTQEHEIELFNEEDHDIKRIKGVVARVSHAKLEKSFYVIKALPQSQVMKGSASWMLRGGKFAPFDADAALRIAPDSQLLVLEHDMYVFSQPKLKALFGYDAKEASIAMRRVREIEANFRLSFAEDVSMQALIKGKRSLIKKLQTLNPNLMTQDELMNHAEEMGMDLMQDDSGAIIIINDKDMSSFINLLNDDIIESPITGLRYEIKSKKPLKISEESGTPTDS